MSAAITFLLVVTAATERVAVCILGRIRAVEIAAKAQQQNLYDVLCGGSCKKPQNSVDIFMSGPLENALQLEAAAALFKDFQWMVKGVRFQDESGVLQSLSRRFPETCQEALRIRGNWLGTSKRLLRVSGRTHRRSGPGIFMMYGSQHCLEMIEAHEELLSLEYDRVVTTRTDLFWAFAHPPLTALSPSAAWIPDTWEDDWGGLYDRHLVYPRSAARWVLGGWDMLTSGKAFRLLLEVLGEGALLSNSTNTEVWLAARLLAGQVPVSRFPATAYLSCDLSEWTTKGGATWAGPNTFHGSVHGFKCLPGGYRYPKEKAAVDAFVKCLEGQGGWSRAAAQKCYCGHLEPHDLYALCTNSWGKSKQNAFEHGRR